MTHPSKARSELAKRLRIIALTLLGVSAFLFLYVAVADHDAAVDTLLAELERNHVEHFGHL
jgi:hypothetical protein